MTVNHMRWSLGTKMVLVLAPFLILVLATTAITLWVSWQLDGGAAAVNEAGRMRMLTYRMALSVSRDEMQELPSQINEFNAVLSLLRQGDRTRPLLIPWDATVRGHFGVVELNWKSFQVQWLGHPSSNLRSLGTDAVAFVKDIDTLVRSIESHLSRWTTTLHWLQMGALFLSVIWTGVLVIAGHRLVLSPLKQLTQAVHEIQGGDLGARIHQVTTDEFGTLVVGFNEMAEHLQLLYRDLEGKVREKTAELQEKHERLESLYEVTARVAGAASVEELTKDFVNTLRRIAKADGVALRWSDQSHQRHLMLASSGLPDAMVEAENCLAEGDCYCGAASPVTGLAVIPISSLPVQSFKHCTKAGFSTVVNVPIRLQEQVMGEVSLFFYAEVSPCQAECSLLEALNRQLASGMENFRLSALAREAAVSGERHHLSCELHDSIAQSLAFLKIQVQLMREALQAKNEQEIQKVLDEIDTGVRESYGDVRELLMHFRTRANTEDIESALAITLRKFEHQSGLKTTLAITGNGLPLRADFQIQILHIVQEALSNVRKHARASQVWLSVQRQPQWRFEVRDDGIGFSTRTGELAETHVGLRIMAERAQRIGATLSLESSPRVGSSVVVQLPESPASIAPADAGL
jgi:two-component system nitrate/nitrite sensor histidine kinase NarX